LYVILLYNILDVVGRTFLLHYARSNLPGPEALWLLAPLRL